MKKFIYTSALVCLAFGYCQAQLTKNERKKAISYYKETAKALKKAVKGLNEAQLAWKPDTETWSVANCVEHIAISEKLVFDWATSTLKEAPSPEKRRDLKFSDDEIISMVSSRAQKVKTGEAFKPTGQFGGTAETLKTFESRRKANVNWIKTTQDDLRSHFVNAPMGMADTYQMILFLNAHTQRHLAQLEEVKAMAGFPK